MNDSRFPQVATTLNERNHDQLVRIRNDPHKEEAADYCVQRLVASPCHQFSLLYRRDPGLFLAVLMPPTSPVEIAESLTNTGRHEHTVRPHGERRKCRLDGSCEMRLEETQVACRRGMCHVCSL